MSTPAKQEQPTTSAAAAAAAEAATTSEKSATGSAWASPPRNPTASSRMTTASAMSINEEDDKKKKQKRRSSSSKQQKKPAAEPSIQDRLTATALSGTLELLRQVGGVTLSTTGALVAPPLHVTKTFLLPQLWAATKDYLATNSPERLRDWFRIVQSSLYHLVNTLKNTEKGHAFRTRFLTALADAVECLSSETTRQALMDTTSGMIRLAEALNTPEFDAFLEQAAITCCRYVDVAANARNKLFIHDWRIAVSSFCELLADPATTLALAEVTAYLCYALEMEEHKQSTSVSSAQTSKKRRNERDDYQRATELERITIGPGRTVEQIILSSLGGGAAVPGETRTDGSDSDCVPECITLEQEANTTEQPWEGSSSIPQQQAAGQHQSTTSTTAGHPLPEENDDDACHDDDNNEDDDKDEEEEWMEEAGNVVNVKVLRDGIEERAVHIQALKHSRTANIQDLEDHRVETATGADDGLEDEHQEDSHANEDEPNDKRRQHIALNMTPSSSDLQDVEKVVGFKDDAVNVEDDWDGVILEHPMPLEGETSSQHFQRILDEILTHKRKEAVQATLEGDTEKKAQLLKSGAMRRPRAKPGSLKERLTTLRATLNPTKAELERKARIEKILGKRGKSVVLLGLAMAGFIIFAWFCFGCYGLYVFFYQQPAADPASTVPPTMSPRAPPSPSEVVIRVVKEVIHIDHEGREIKKGPWSEAKAAISEDEHEKIAQCVANLY